MNHLAGDCLIAAARADRRERSLSHARHCVTLAVVTSEPIAAELIDRAVELSAAARVELRATPTPRLAPAYRT